jgi:hypothetical protein
MSNYQKIRRTLQALFDCYPNQKIDKLVVVMCLNDVEFQSKYVNY